MVVYVILVGYDYEGSNISHITDNKEKAEEFKKSVEKEYRYDYVDLQEWEVE